MEHEHGAFKVNLKTFPCHPLARLRNAPKTPGFALVDRDLHAATQK
jgi:hypothetical protein